MPEAYIIIGIVLAVVVGISISWYYSKKRTDALTALAETLGFSFSKQADESVLVALADLQLFSRGHARKIRNLMSGSDRGIDMKVFDYRYTTGGGKNSHTHRQTVLLIQADRAAFPSFSLRPENVFHKIGKMFGYQDINWETHPMFSKHYLLRSNDEQSCRAVFTEEVIDLFEKEAGLSVEAGNNKWVYYKASKVVSPQDLGVFVKAGTDVFGLFFKGQKQSS